MPLFPPVHVLTVAEALPEYREEVLSVLCELAELCRQEEGCLRFDLYCDTNHPCRLNTIEVWDSLDAHARHLNSTLVGRGVLMLIGKVKGLPDIRILTPLSEMS
ncbi:putative quinol monooxygenase [Uliginosibacterium gangwonense]|uniref:putative quinol monooxygenase n=1 Tax=Uliginosibacterium gangwonense TaxID=392736 RepID=UPI000367A824|nr:putative quinol monooxygenase [Uliginosibacterium gangwonense]